MPFHTRTYLVQSPALADDGVLDAVQDKAVDLLLHDDGHLPRLRQQLLCRHHHIRVRPGGRNHLHQGRIERRVSLQRNTVYFS